MKTNLSQKILLWIDIYKEMKKICHPFMVSLLTVCINSLVHIDFAVAPVDSSAQFTKSLNKSTTAPVG
jgi:hypothetical protein